jgi:hypothetical protein
MRTLSPAKLILVHSLTTPFFIAIFGEEFPTFGKSTFFFVVLILLLPYSTELRKPRAWPQSSIYKDLCRGVWTNHFGLNIYINTNIVSENYALSY